MPREHVGEHEERRWNQEGEEHRPSQQELLEGVRRSGRSRVHAGAADDGELCARAARQEHVERQREEMQAKA